MLGLAHDIDSKLASSSESTCVYDSSGVLMDDQKVSDGFTAFWDMLADAIRHSNENCGTIEPNLSLKDFFQARLAASVSDEEFRTVVLELAEMWGAFVGDPFERQSLKVALARRVPRRR